MAAKMETLLHTLGQRIISGSFTGALPSENALANTFNVSRTTVRAALQALVARGLVEVKPASGAHVREQEKWDWLDEQVLEWAGHGESRPQIQSEGFEARLLIEPAIAEYAAQRASGEDLADLERAVSAMEAHRDDIAHFNMADLAFHQALSRASGNRVLIRMGVVLEGVQKVFFDHSFHYDADELDLTLSLHRSLVEAIRFRDTGRARQLAERLVYTCDQHINQQHLSDE